jgi:Protein of unknown function (DUF3604)
VRPAGAHAGDEMTTSTDGWRHSRIRSDDAFLVVADLHNHTLMSDGRGDPERAFAQMRAAGLDVAALTDHASIPREQRDELGLHQYPDAGALDVARHMPRSFDDAAWERTAELADEFDVPGVFTALRGFEWTEPWVGHVNVWFSDSYQNVDTPGSLGGLFTFLAEREQKALFGYNHPGREGGRHEEFSARLEGDGTDGDLSARMVALEAFNRGDDYLFGLGDADSAIVACLDAGWRPGLIGCSDEHGAQYGLAGRGRTGLWVHEHSRSGVRDALAGRRSFATREVGLRLDATLDGVPMGSAGSLGERAELAVDLGFADGGHDGEPVELQLLVSGAATGGVSPEVSVVARVPALIGEVTRVTVDVPAPAPWTVLRVADPTRPYGPSGGGGRAPHGHPADCRALAYASPWWREA